MARPLQLQDIYTSLVLQYVQSPNANNLSKAMNNLKKWRMGAQVTNDLFKVQTSKLSKSGELKNGGHTKLPTSRRAMARGEGGGTTHCRALHISGSSMEGV